MLGNYAKIAFRNINRNKTYTFINVLGLAAAMALCIVIFLWINQQLSYDKFYANYDRIYRPLQKGINNGQEYGNPTLPYKVVPILREEFPEVETGARLRTYGATVRHDNKKFLEDGLIFAEPQLFEIFDFKFVQGSKQTLHQRADWAVIDKTTAEKYFSSEIDPVGKSMKIENHWELTVAAVIEDIPQNSSLQFDIAIPFQLLGERKINSWSWESTGYIMFKPGVDAQNFASKIKQLIRNRSGRNENGLLIQPLAHEHLYTPLDEPGLLRSVTIFSSIALVVLIIACINFMNLTIALSMKRFKEIGVRKVMGAKKSQLIRQFIFESLLIAFIAITLAYALTEVFLPLLNAQLGLQLHLSGQGWLLFGVMAGLTLFAGFFAGSYPAFYLARYEPEEVLRYGRNGRSKNLFRKILVIFQFVISIALIITTIFISRQLQYVNNKDLGLDTEQVVYCISNSQLRQHYKSFKQELVSQPGITAVTRSSSLPTNVSNVNGVKWEGKKDDEMTMFYFELVDPDFIEFFNLEIVQGRGFSEELQGEKDEAFILNERAIEIMGMEDPIGKKFTMYDDEGRIVGVVKNFHMRPLNQEIQPLILYQGWWRRFVYVKIDSDNMMAATKKIEKVYNKFAPDYTFQLSFLDDTVQRYYQELSLMDQLVTYFAFFAIIISCLGLFGLSAFMVQQRKKEIGIRKVLGSSSTKIVKLITKDFTIWVLLANLIAWPIAYFVIQKFLQMFAYHIKIDVWYFLLALAISLLIAWVTVLGNAIKAANTNPAEVVMYE
jgi:predicted permease